METFGASAVSRSATSRTPGWIGGVALVLTVLSGGGALAVWKASSITEQAAAASTQPEPMEAVAAVPAESREHRPRTTAIGTVLALHSVTLRNELAGTVRQVALEPGRIVNRGAVLVALDVSVERAELEALQARLTLARTTLGRLQRLYERRAVSAEEVDRAQAERDVAEADIARVRAIIERKTIRAPFRSRIGLADVHPGQYLSEGTVLTTLQGVDEEANVDFTVAQDVAARLQAGDTVLVSSATRPAPLPARIVAIDARVDPTTRNASVRARLRDRDLVAAPGASVRVEVPVGTPIHAVAVPVSALRKGPAGDHVFVIAPDEERHARARLRTVKAGDVLGDEVLILEGLSPGEQVAASGSFKLRDGVLVALANAAAPAGAGSH
jgi:membrane fusion protein (multidrug efflux system)